MSNAEALIGFGQDDNKVMNGGRVERYKGKKNQTDRIAIAWFFKDDDGNYRMAESDTPKFKMANYHYAPGLGYINAKGEYTTQKFGPPKRRIGTIVVKYSTDRQGSLPKGADGKPQLDFQIMEWQFGEDKYRLLATIHEEFPLTKHDIKVTCTDAQYQKLSFTACNGEALWQRNENLKSSILERVAEMAHQVSLCRDLSVQEIKEHYGESEDAVPDVSSDIDYDDLMEDIE
jgi:hypothetical protein